MATIFDTLKLEEHNPVQMFIILAILESYNCRASEVLDAKWTDFFPQKFLILRGKKHSSNVIVRDRLILNSISNLERIHPEKIFPSVNYFKLYRFVKARYSHLFKKFKKRKNFKVTHGFRYENVSQFDNEEIIRDILHHRSTKSGKYYKITSRSSQNGKNS